MTQLDAIALRIVEFRPFKMQRTAHAFGRARAEDDEYYIVKGDRPGPAADRVCATEWICSSIADSLRLPIARSRILRADDGALVFGSREIGSKLPDIEAERILLGDAGNEIFIPNLAESLSSTYALDLAIGNTDRHQSNFIISLSEGGGSQRIGSLELIDFGSSDLLADARIGVPFPRTSNTVRIGRLIRAKHGFANPVAEGLLSRLREGRKFIAERAMIGLPSEWLSKEKRDAFSSWMTGSAFEDRLSRIENGLRNGSYL